MSTTIELMDGGAAHPAEPHHDDVKCGHDGSYRRMRSCFGSNNGSAATRADRSRSK